MQVDVRGEIDLGDAPAGKLVVVLTDGPCFQVGSHFIATLPAHRGQPYAVTVFPPRGSQLDVCAALVVGERRLTPWHGRAAAAPLEATGSVLVYRHADVKLTKTVPVRVPAALKLD